MKFKIIFSLLSFLVFTHETFSQPGCRYYDGYVLKGNLHLNDSVSLPIYFQLNLGAEPNIVMWNAEEKIKIEDVRITNDSVNFSMPVFNSEFHCTWCKQDSPNSCALKGFWINHNRTTKNIIPFDATKINSVLASTEYWRMQVLAKAFKGKWETTFSPPPADSANTYKSIGVFRTGDCVNALFGTFLTETGDYRYLMGNADVKNGDTTMQLSCFDGSHAFVFTAKKNKDGTISGDFYSGKHWHEPFIAKRNENFELQNPDSLTYLKPGFTKVDFSFPDTYGRKISLSDAQFKNKVVIIQIMGSWCPNCMDETKFLETLYKKYHTQGLEIVALAFEKTDDSLMALNNVVRFKTILQADYNFLLTGDVGKDEASAAIPMLNEVMAFPTTIFIDKKGNVRKISTGFSGPGTGIYFDKYAEQTNLFVQQMLGE